MPYSKERLNNFFCEKCQKTGTSNIHKLPGIDHKVCHACYHKRKQRPTSSNTTPTTSVRRVRLTLNTTLAPADASATVIPAKRSRSRSPSPPSSSTLPKQDIAVEISPHNLPTPQHNNSPTPQLDTATHSEADPASATTSVASTPPRPPLHPLAEEYSAATNELLARAARIHALSTTFRFALRPLPEGSVGYELLAQTAHTLTSLTAHIARTQHQLHAIMSVLNEDPAWDSSPHSGH